MSQGTFRTLSASANNATKAVIVHSKENKAGGELNKSEYREIQSVIRAM